MVWKQNGVSKWLLMVVGEFENLNYIDFKFNLGYKMMLEDLDIVELSLEKLDWRQNGKELSQG